ncbi:hypothetical protein NDA13_001092 [Ustilago tritici]|nr:hypothetical protein NDA13_001092 [Ustilago tritici]
METSAGSQAASSTSQSLNATCELIAILVVFIKPFAEEDQYRFEKIQKIRRRYDQAFNRWLPHITLIPPFKLSPASSSNDEPPASLEDLLSLHEQKLSQIAQAALEVCNRHQAHTSLLDQVSTFPLRKYKNVHLRPYPTNFKDKGTEPASYSSAEPAQDETTADDAEDYSSHRILQLQKELANAVEPHKTKDRRSSVYKPHVSVGQSTSPKATWQLFTKAERVLRAHSAPQPAENRPGLLCNVDCVQLMVKQKGYKGPYQIHRELPLSKT